MEELRYSRGANVKTVEGSSHRDRNAQFEYINAETTSRLKAGSPVISVDTKKKELVGPFKNNGRTWQSKEDPANVSVLGFIDPELGPAGPTPMGSMTSQPILAGLALAPITMLRHLHYKPSGVGGKTSASRAIVLRRTF